MFLCVLLGFYLDIIIPFRLLMSSENCLPSRYVLISSKQLPLVFITSLFALLIFFFFSNFALLCFSINFTFKTLFQVSSNWYLYLFLHRLSLQISVCLILCTVSVDSLNSILFNTLDVFPISVIMFLVI